MARGDVEPDNIRSDEKRVATDTHILDGTFIFFKAGNTDYANSLSRIYSFDKCLCRVESLRKRDV